MLFNIKNIENSILANKIIEHNSDEFESLVTNLIVLQQNYRSLLNMSSTHKATLNSILFAYYGNTLPEIKKYPLVILDYIEQVENFTDIEYTIEDYNKAGTTKEIWKLIDKLNNIKANEGFKKNIVLTLNLGKGTPRIMVIEALLETNQLVICRKNRYESTCLENEISSYVKTFLLWISKNIKKQEMNLENMVQQDYSDILTSINIEKLHEIQQKVILQELYKNLKLDQKLNELLVEKERKIKSLIEEIEQINDRYMVQVTKITNYNNNFKNMFEQTSKTVNYHINKTKYLHCHPEISLVDNVLQIKIKTNILPVVNMDKIEAYIKTYGNTHTEKELEYINKIKNGEAFLAVCPEEIWFSYSTESNKTMSRKFSAKNGGYYISRNSHADISGGSGCLGTFVNLFTEAANELDVNKTIINTINYLQSVSPLDIAGKRSFINLLVVDEFGEKIIFSHNKDLIGKTREEVSKEIWQKYES